MEHKIIGNKITDARKKLNLSQAQLAQKLFISPQAVGKWERGESFPDIITFGKLAKILGVDLNYFSDNFQTTKPELSTENIPSSTSDLLEPKNKSNKLKWDMSRGNWVDADFSGLKNLQDKFSSSNMKNCKFVGSELSGLLLKNNNIEKCDFSDSNLNKSEIINSNLANNLYISSDLSQLQLKSNNINKCDFTNSNFSYGKVESTNFEGNQFKNCMLMDSEFNSSHINSCDFSGADFTGTKFKSGGFGKNRIENAVWNHTSFVSMWLTDLIFEGKIEDCYFENCSFKKVVFQNSVLLNTFFKNKSLKNIRFSNCQADRITFEFLKNGKADLSGIVLLSN